MGLLKEIFRPNLARCERDARRTKEAFVTAKAAYDDALDRGDTRDQGKLWSALREAREAQMAAERALRLEEGRK